MSLAAIVASLHGRTGKTFLAQMLVDYFSLSGGKPYVFDTDAVERGLHCLFPDDARVVDLASVRDQMVLFDTLVKPSRQMRVVDVTHRSLVKFFEVLRDTDFILEARSHDIETVIFYIPDRRIDSFEGGVILRDSFDCPFIVVDNAIFEEPKRDVREALAYKALKAHKAHFAMPKLSEEVVDALEGCGLSLRNFVRQPMSSSGEGPVPDGLALELRIALRAWVLKVFLEIHRVTGYLARISSSASTVASESSVQLTRGQRRIRT